MALSHTQMYSLCGVKSIMFILSTVYFLLIRIKIFYLTSEKIILWQNLDPLWCLHCLFGLHALNFNNP